MAIFYLDTSAVLKRCRTEIGTDVVDEIYERQAAHDALVTSQFTCLELESVAIRALKGKLLTRQSYDALLGSFANDIGDNLLLAVFSEQLMDDAINVARGYALRAPDAMQLAAARDSSRTTTGGAFVFVSSDKELLAAARSSFRVVLDPESDGATSQLRQLRRDETR